MAINTFAYLTNSLSWQQQDTEILSTLTDNGSIISESIMENGTGNSQVNCVYHCVRTIPSGLTDVLDLTYLTRQLFNDTITTSFLNGKVRSLIIANTASGLGEDIKFNATGVGWFADPFDIPSGVGNQYLKHRIGPLSSYSVSNTVGGWPITNTNKFISVQDCGSGCAYQIAIAGTKI